MRGAGRRTAQCLVRVLMIPAVIAGVFTVAVVPTSDRVRGGSASVVAPPQSLSGPHADVGTGDWTQLGHDATHAGLATDETQLSVDNIDHLALAWTGIGISYSAAPVVVNGIVYQGTDGGVFAYPADCGTGGAVCSPLWRASVFGGMVRPGSIAASDNRVFFALDQSGNQLRVYDAHCRSDGGLCDPLWTGRTNGYPQTVAVSNGVAYVGADDGLLYAFDAAGSTGCSAGVCQPLWTADAGSRIRSTPAVSNGSVFVATESAFSAFDATGTVRCSGSPKTCLPLWRANLHSIYYQSPIVANGLVYVAADYPQVAVDAFPIDCRTDGGGCTPTWAGRPLDSAEVGFAFGGLAYADGRVYAQSFDGLYAFDAAGVEGCTGNPAVCQPVWTGWLPLNAGPSLANGLVLASTPLGLSAYDTANLDQCAGTPLVCDPVWIADAPSGDSLASQPSRTGACSRPPGKTTRASGRQTRSPRTRSGPWVRWTTSR